VVFVKDKISHRTTTPSPARPGQHGVLGL